MPSFSSRIGKHSNRSQQNLLDQQQQLLQHQQQLSLSQGASPSQQQQPPPLPTHHSAASSLGGSGPGSRGGTDNHSIAVHPSPSSATVNATNTTTTTTTNLPTVGSATSLNTTPASASSTTLISNNNINTGAGGSITTPPSSSVTANSSITDSLRQVDPRATQQSPQQPILHHPSPHHPQLQQQPQPKRLSKSPPASQFPQRISSLNASPLQLQQLQLDVERTEQQRRQQQQQQQSSYTAAYGRGDTTPEELSAIADLVSRSSSSRYTNQTVLPPIQTQHPFPANPSTDHLPLPSHASSPIVPPSQPNPAETTKKSARQRLKNILQSATSSVREQQQHHHSHHQSHHSLGGFDSSPGLSRKGSKRSSAVHAQPPPFSHQTLEQQQQQQQPPPPPHYTQSSPLKNVGEVEEDIHNIGRPSPDIQPQSPPDVRQAGIRQVSAETNPASYSRENLAAFQQQQQSLAQHQALLEAQSGQQQQHLYGQVVVDPADPQYRYEPPQPAYQAGNRGSLYIGHLNTASTPNIDPESVSQLSHESPVTETDLSTRLHSTQASPLVSHAQHDFSPHQSQQQIIPPVSQSQQLEDMPPPPGQSGASRRSGETDKNLPRPGDSSSNSQQGYRHSQTPMNSMHALPPTPGQTATTPSYGGRSDRQHLDGPGAEAGRNSPQPSTGGDPESEKQFKELLTKYKNVKRLYFEGKSQIEQMNSQVEQLQNAVANQRMSASRTALDDNEYSTRFNRLNGAITNLAFNIRKDWKRLPEWIEKYVSPDALKTGKQEMTAAGRAVIMHWVFEELFNKCFHPGLEMGLSSHLKAIEKSIRQNSYTLSSQEEFDALTTKIVNWRMATLEGLHQALNSPQSGEYRTDLTKKMTTNLTEYLYKYLNDPPPAGVDGSASMIIELAVGISGNLPLESRDVAMSYPMPETPINLEIMEPEKSGLPPLPDPPEDSDDSSKDGENAGQHDKSKSGMLAVLKGTAPSSRKGSTASITDMATSGAGPAKDPARVRFAGFIAVEVRGRQVLVKAPFWPLG